MIWVSSRLCLKDLLFSPSGWHLTAQLSRNASAVSASLCISLHWQVDPLAQVLLGKQPHSFHYCSDRHIPMWKLGFVSFTSCSKREAALVGLNLKACPAKKKKKKNSCMITNQCCFPRNDITAVFRGWLNMSVWFVFVGKTYSYFLFIITNCDKLS